MRLSLRAFLIGAVSALTLPIAAHATVTFESAQLDVNGYAYDETAGTSLASISQTYSYTGSGNYSASNFQSFSGVDYSGIIAPTAGLGLSATSGNLYLPIFSVVDTLPGEPDAIAAGSSDYFLYLFNTTAPVKFSFTYNATTSDFTQGNGTLSDPEDIVAVQNTSYQLYDLVFLPDNGTGGGSVILPAGSYYFSAENEFDEAYSSGGSGLAAQGTQADFVYDITAVPEPATWATTILGLFGVGAMLRRRRHQLARA